MFAKLLSSLYTSVFVAYKSTILGLALVGADAIISTLQAATLPTWAHTVVGIVASLLVLYKGSTKPVVQPVP